MESHRRPNTPPQPRPQRSTPTSTIETDLRDDIIARRVLPFSFLLSMRPGGYYPSHLVVSYLASHLMTYSVVVVPSSLCNGLGVGCYATLLPRAMLHGLTHAMSPMLTVFNTYGKRVPCSCYVYFCYGGPRSFIYFFSFHVLRINFRVAATSLGFFLVLLLLQGGL
jgi:hypothetical protein